MTSFPVLYKYYEACITTCLTANSRKGMSGNKPRHVTSSPVVPATHAVRVGQVPQPLPKQQKHTNRNVTIRCARGRIQFRNGNCISANHNMRFQPVFLNRSYGNSF